MSNSRSIIRSLSNTSFYQHHKQLILVLFLLQLAAELDRSTTAELLIEAGAPAGVYDDNKLAALVVMIEKMPSVVRALQCFMQSRTVDSLYNSNTYGELKKSYGEFES